MPREYARRPLKTWDDPGFTGLDLAHQGFLTALHTYSGTSWCGVIDYLPKRLVRCACDITEAKVVKMVGHLQARGYLLLDTTHDELLIRRFIRDEDVMKMLNVGKSMANAYKRVGSPSIRDAIVEELTKLWGDRPELKGWVGLAQVNAQLYDEIVGNSSTSPLFNPSGNPSSKA
jgi:hypothetical protein